MDRTASLLLLLAAALTAGCATFPGFTPPEVTLVDVRFTDLTLFESSGRLTVRVANENEEPIRVDGGVYNLFLGGVKVGKGLSDARFEVGRLSTETADVDIFINNLALASRIARIVEEGEVDYRLKGRFYLDRSLGPRRIRFDRVGNFDFRPDDATTAVAPEVERP